MDRLSFRKAWEIGWRPPDRRPIYEWARENVYLPRGVYTIDGPFRIENSPYLREPFDELQNDLVRKVTVRAPVRSGKSLIPDIWIPWIALNAPNPVMWNLATDALSKRHAETRIQPVLDNTAGMADLLPLDRHKRRGQEIIFRNGMPLYVQGPSLGNTQGVGIRYLIEDELWARNAGEHEQALARLGDYERLGNAKVLNLGQAGTTDDDLDREFMAGDQRFLFVPCLNCGKFFNPVTTGRRRDRTLYGLRWNEEARTPAGMWDIPALLPTVRYECFHCGHAHTDYIRTKDHWFLTGRYERQNPNPEPGCVSFHIPGTLVRDWKALAHELCAAHNARAVGNLEPMIAFRQKREALPWSEEAFLLDESSPVYELNTEWKEETERLMTVDCQAEGVYWALICAWSKKGEVRRVWYGRLLSEGDLIAKAKEHKAKIVMLDSGFEAKRIYAMCVRNNWIALKGDDVPSYKHTIRKGNRNHTIERSYSPPIAADPELGQAHGGRTFAMLVRWSNPTIKDRLAGHMRKGRWIEPDTDPEAPGEKEYYRQMRGQWKANRKHPTTGRVIWFWKDNGDDHARDCACMQVVGASILSLLPDVIEAELLTMAA